jgi:uncharacterized protein YndB with AHSA1/START domain
MLVERRRNRSGEPLRRREENVAFETSVDIHRPPQQVFEFIADFRRMPEWYEAVQQVTTDGSGPAHPGARFTTARSLPGGMAYNEVEVVVFQPSDEIAIASISGPTPFRYHYRLADIPGGTRLTLNGDISAEGLPGPAGLLGGLATRLFHQGMKKNLQVLKRILEA